MVRFCDNFLFLRQYLVTDKNGKLVWNTILHQWFYKHSRANQYLLFCKIVTLHVSFFCFKHGYIDKGSYISAFIPSWQFSTRPCQHGSGKFPGTLGFVFTAVSPQKAIFLPRRLLLKASDPLAASDGAGPWTDTVLTAMFDTLSSYFFNKMHYFE